MTEIDIPPRSGRVMGVPETGSCPGRNHPGIGAWLLDTFAPGPTPVVVDPMMRAGQLWFYAPSTARVLGCELDGGRVQIATRNGFECYHQRAETWRLPDGHTAPHLVAFSPPYPNADHGNGETASQVAMREEKRLAAVQTCPGTRNLLPVFLQVSTYSAHAPVAVIVRNWIERGQEVDWVSEVEQSMRFAGFKQVDRFYRRLQPGPFTQMKLKSGKQTVWVDKEIVLVGRLR